MVLDDDDNNDNDNKCGEIGFEEEANAIRNKHYQEGEAPWRQQKQL